MVTLTVLPLRSASLLGKDTAAPLSAEEGFTPITLCFVFVFSIIFLVPPFFANCAFQIAKKKIVPQILAFLSAHGRLWREELDLERR